MLTGDTITDEQIRELQAEAEKIVCGSSPYHLVFPKRERPGVELLFAATYALGEDRWIAGYRIDVAPGHERVYRDEGRRYCAEILNTRITP
jgi:hypothetical protein